ncbi:tetratricopeptide repeat protein [Sphingomonas sp. RS2018]
MPISGMAETDALLRIAYAAAEEGDFAHARACYERGAALGDGMCFQALGYMYDVGEGVAKDKVIAMKLYRAAWRRGDHAAASNIAVIYRERGEMRTMFKWFERLARAGDGSAQLEMAKCYLSGVGVRKDIQAALRCLAVASNSYYITEYEREEAEALLQTLKLRLSK